MCKNILKGEYMCEVGFKDLFVSLVFANLLFFRIKYFLKVIKVDIFTPSQVAAIMQLIKLFVCITHRGNFVMLCQASHGLYFWKLGALTIHMSWKCV